MSTYRSLTCPHCGERFSIFANPVPTVDIIIEVQGGIVLIERKNPPYGWALPGGFVDYGECLEDAARREAREETGLDVTLRYLLGTYSDPGRDLRQHTISTVFVAEAAGKPRAGDDALAAAVFALAALPPHMVFDHPVILKNYSEFVSGKRPAIPVSTRVSCP